MNFILSNKGRIAAVEVKSGIFEKPHAGLQIFGKRWPAAKTWRVDPGGIGLEDFLRSDLEFLF